MVVKDSDKGPKTSGNALRCNVKQRTELKKPTAKIENKILKSRKNQKSDAVKTEAWKSHKRRNLPIKDSIAWIDLPGIELIPWGELATDKSLY